MWPPSKCDASRTGYGLRPSSLRVGVSTPCMTASTGMTFCGRRGSGSEPIVAPRGLMQLTVAAVEDYGVERMLDELPGTSVQASTTRRQCGGWRFQSPTGRNARWASRL